MPFQYTPYRNQYVGSITDLMGRGRDAEAQALIDSANAQAQAAQVSGQAWGGAVQGIGNTIAAIPGQIQAQQDRDRVMEQRERDDQARELRAETYAPPTIGSSILPGTPSRMKEYPPSETAVPFYEEGPPSKPVMRPTLPTSETYGPGMIDPYRTEDANGSNIFDLEKIMAAFASAGLDPPDMSPYIAINQEITGRFGQSLLNARGVARTLLEGPSGAWEQGLRTSLGVYEANGLLPAPMLASMRAQLEDIQSLPSAEKEARLGQLLHQLTGETIETQIVKPGDIAATRVPCSLGFKTEAIGVPDQNLTGEEQALDAYAHSLDLGSRFDLSHAQRSEYTREQRELSNPGTVVSIADPTTGVEAYWTRSPSGELSRLLLPDGSHAKPRAIRENRTFYSINGENVLLTQEEAAQQGAGPPPTADMRNKTEGRRLVKASIVAIEDLSKDIIGKVGPQQRLEAIQRGTAAIAGYDAAFRTYQDARRALAGNLAVAQQGSRPSDADISAVWLPLVPDAYSDTRESAEMKWDLIYLISNVSPSNPTIGDELNNLINSGASADELRDFAISALDERAADIAADRDI